MICLVLAACTPGVNKSRVEMAKTEIVQTERDFEVMAKEKGLSGAFSYYADSTAVMSRGSYLIHGKDSIRLFYLAPGFNGVKLAWKPDFVDVSADSNLGYTYGRYTFSSLDSTGKSSVSTGIFHTVWKRQANGQWRFVWD